MIAEWIVVLVVGGVGGLIHPMLIGAGIRGWMMYTDAEGRRSFDPGLLGDILIGAVTGLVFWGFFTSNPTFGSPLNEARPIIGALVAGVGGGKLLTSYIDASFSRSSIQNLNQTLKSTIAQRSDSRLELTTERSLPTDPDSPPPSPPEDL